MCRNAPSTSRGVKRTRTGSFLFGLPSPPTKSKRRTTSARDGPASKRESAEEGETKVVKATKPKRVKGRKGKLAFILQAPTEIVLQIMSHLWPLDILRLSYVDKELRTMLTQPNNKFIWEAARNNVPGLPDLPPDLTEWAYARLLWVNECDVCGARALAKTTWAHLRMRLCNKCYKEHLAPQFRLRNQFIYLHFNRIELLPGWLPPNSSDRICFGPAANRLARRAEQGEDMPEWEAWEERQREMMKEVREHADLLQAWMAEREVATHQQSKERKARRKAAILERLRALGYEEADVDAIRDHRLLKSSEELTARNWEKVKETIIPRLEQIKDTRTRRELDGRNRNTLRQVYHKRWASLPDSEEKWTTPPFTDFVSFPSCIRTLEDAQAPGSDLMLCCQRNVPDIKREKEHFRTKMQRDLFRKYDQYERRLSLNPWTGTGVNKNDFTRYRFLKRATTVFVCSECQSLEPLHYESLFSHSCPLRPRTDLPEHDYPLSSTWDQYSKNLRVDTAAIEVMENIVKRAKLHPDIATIRDLTQLGQAFDRPNEDRPTRKIDWRELYRELMALRHPSS